MLHCTAAHLSVIRRCTSAAVPAERLQGSTCNAAHGPTAPRLLASESGGWAASGSNRVRNIQGEAAMCVTFFSGLLCLIGRGEQRRAEQSRGAARTFALSSRCADELKRPSPPASASAPSLPRSRARSPIASITASPELIDAGSAGTRCRSCSVTLASRRRCGSVPSGPRFAIKSTAIQRRVLRHGGAMPSGVTRSIALLRRRRFKERGSPANFFVSRRVSGCHASPWLLEGGGPLPAPAPAPLRGWADDCSKLRGFL